MIMLFEFMSNNPWLSFFLAVGFCEVLLAVFFKLPNRIIRGMNIRKNGWPPEHCDADGDFKTEPEKEDE